MATDAYMAFMDYNGKWLQSESQVSWSDGAPLAKDASSGIDLSAAAKNNGLFELEDYSFDIEQTLNIGSQSSGAGAGKVAFNPFTITRRTDMSSPTLFQMACSGTPFKNVTLALRKASGGTASASVFLRYDFKLVAVKTISWMHDEDTPKEIVSFEYGAMQVRYTVQKPDGSFGSIVPGSWNRVTNTNSFVDIAGK